jgi:hypothetical protein
MHNGTIYFSTYVILLKPETMRQMNFILIALLTLCTYGAQAQIIHGNVGLGIRANPDGGGITGKFFFTEQLAVEAQLNGSSGSYSEMGTSFTVGSMLEYHFIFPRPEWRIFLGGGIHYGTWNRYGDSHVSPFSIFGLDAIGGVEYIFASVPIGVSVDVKPALNFISGVTSFPNNGFGVGIRYYFGHWRCLDKVQVVEVENSGDNEDRVIELITPR